MMITFDSRFKYSPPINTYVAFGSVEGTRIEFRIAGEEVDDYHEPRGERLHINQVLAEIACEVAVKSGWVARHGVLAIRGYGE